MRFGLERMGRLLALLGNPQAGLPALHVVGTNGKSSTTRMAAAALGAQGLTVGTFTSPHLLSFAERIGVADAQLTETAFSAAVSTVADAVLQLDLASDRDDRVTQFEAVNAAAFVALRAARCDAVVIEAGLGGRLDSTNVLSDSRVQVLTSVGIDHTQYLGETVAEIAGEKLAVVRDGGVLVTGPLDAQLRALALKTVISKGAQLVAVTGERKEFGDLAGAFMRVNASVALAAAEQMFTRLGGKRFDHDGAVAAITAIVWSGQLDGRFAVHGHDPLVIFDCAHNAAAAIELVDAVRELGGDRPVTLLLAMLGDKQVGKTLEPLLAAAAGVVCTSVANPRSLSASQLAVQIAQLSLNLPVVEADEAHGGLALAIEQAGKGGLVLATGSNYLIGDLLATGRRERGATF